METNKPFALWVHVALLKPNSTKVESIWLESMLNNNFERVGDAARPEGIPDLIDLTANFAGKHR